MGSQHEVAKTGATRTSRLSLYLSRDVIRKSNKALTILFVAGDWCERRPGPYNVGNQKSIIYQHGTSAWFIALVLWCLTYDDFEKKKKNRDIGETSYIK